MGTVRIAMVAAAANIIFKGILENPHELLQVFYHRDRNEAVLTIGAILAIAPIFSDGSGGRHL
ncbi:hypothetical protein [Rhizobium sp. GR12]|uniref:hypothetical protein n=1 Tax=Rhizobium sp. GR12 TaxID=3053925 RepID=UPI002FBF156A